MVLYNLQTSDPTGQKFKNDLIALVKKYAPQVDLTTINNALSNLQSQADATTTDMESLQSIMTNLSNQVAAFGITPENLTTIQALLSAIAENAPESQVADLITQVNTLTSNLLLMSNGDYSPKANLTDFQTLQTLYSSIANQYNILTATSTTNLDTLGQNSIYVPSTVTPVGSLPFPAGTVYVVISIYQDSTYHGQIAFSLNTQSLNGQIASRGYTGSAWGPWRTTSIANGAVQSNLFANYALTIQVGGTNSGTVLNLDTVNQGYYISESVKNLTGDLPFPISTPYWLEYTFSGTIRKQTAYPVSDSLSPKYRTNNGTTWGNWRGF